MAVISSDSLQLALVREDVSGQTPTNPSFDLIRTTGEGLQFSPNTSESDELGGGGRFASPSTVTGFSISGDINFRLAMAPWFREVISGILASAWGECPLIGAPGGAIDTVDRITVGQRLTTYTIEKRFASATYEPGTVGTIAADMTAPAAPTLTVTGGPTIGTAYVVLDIQVTGEQSKHYAVPIQPGAGGMTDAQVATAIVNFLKAEDPANFGGGANQGDAVAAAGVVTLTAPGGGTFAAVTANMGSDQYVYQRFKGTSFSSLSLSISPGNPVTGSIGIAGGEPELDVLPLPGATYRSAGAGAVFTAPEVSELTVGNLFGINTNCWSSLNINIDSQNRGIPCIGFKGDRETVLGTLSVSISGDVFFQDQQLLELLLANKTAGDMVVTLNSATGDILRFDFYDIKVVGGSLAAGGTGQDLTIPAEFQPTPRVVCRDAGGTGWESGMIISTVNTAPNVEVLQPIQATEAGAGTATVTITLSDGPADKLYTLTVSGLGVGGAAIVGLFPVAIQRGETVGQAAAKVAAMLDGQQDNGGTVTIAASATGGVITVTEAGGGTIDAGLTVSLA